MEYKIMRVLVVDLDGTIRFSKSGGFIDGPDDVVLFPDVEAKLWEYKNKGFLIAGATNQGGVAYGLKTVEQVDAEFDAMLRLFDKDPFDMLVFAPNHEEGNVHPYNLRSLGRKPGYGMLMLMEMNFFEVGICIDWDNSLMVGDSAEDHGCASNAGIRFSWANDFFERHEK